MKKTVDQKVSVRVLKQINQTTSLLPLPSNVTEREKEDKEMS